MVKIHQRRDYLKHVMVIYLLIAYFLLSIAFSDTVFLFRDDLDIFFFFLYFISCLEKVLLVHPQEVLASLNKQATYLVNSHNNHNNHLLLEVRSTRFIYFIINIFYRLWSNKYTQCFWSCYYRICIWTTSTATTTAACIWNYCAFYR